MKAFKHFSMDDEYLPLSHDANDNEEEEEIEFHLLEDALYPEVDENEDQVLYRLPPHRRCACHLLNLVASADVAKADTGSLKKLSMQTFSKLTALWNKQNRSSLAADKVRESLGMLLPTPGDTRWNSVYDAVAKVNALLSVPEQETKLDQLLDQLDIKRLQPMHKTFCGRIC